MRFSIRFGKKYETKNPGIYNPENKPEVSWEVSLWRNSNGYGGLQILFNGPYRRLSIWYDPNISVSDMAVEYFYEHTLDAMLGASWHHAGGGAGGDFIFQDLSDEVLKKALEVLVSRTEGANLNSLQKKYIEKGVTLISFLLTPEGKEFREKNNVRSQYGTREKIAEIFSELNKKI